MRRVLVALAFAGLLLAGLVLADCSGGEPPPQQTSEAAGPPSGAPPASGFSDGFESGDTGAWEERAEGEEGEPNPGP